jgi:ATP-binding cassette subfamily B protein
LINPRSRKFLSYYRPYTGRLTVNLACALLSSVTILLIPLCARYITKTILADVTPQTSIQIYQMGAIMLILVALYIFSISVVDYLGHLMGAMMERDMREELFAHFQKLSFGFYDNQKTGQLMSRLTNDSFHMSELYHHGPEDLVISALNFTGAFIILLNINRWLAVIVFLFLPVMMVYAIYFNRQMRRAMRQSKERIGDINVQIEDTLAGIRVVQAYGNEQREQAKFNFENGRFLESRRLEYKSETAFFDGMMLFTQLMPVAVIVFGGIAITRSTLDLPDLLTFLLYIGILIEPIRRFSNFIRLYQEGVTGFERFMEMLEVNPEIQDATDARELEEVQGEIEFRHVDFTYEAEDSRVLKNLSLKIRAGEYVAFVGESGVGKTTLCSLIPRFYDAISGSVQIDGRDVKTIPLASLRQHIGIVQQDVYLFSGTVAENIGYGKIGASRPEVVEAAKQAHAHDFVMALPRGYDTDIGQRGIKLSGGQKQRLSIARVFLKNPKILIFDEATSALDNASERAVQESLECLSHNRTTLVIAHRLSTIQKADRIVVLANGGIAEEGRHADLLKVDGVYAHLYQAHTRL